MSRKLRSIAAKLEDGIRSDIWYDANSLGDRRAAELINTTHIAMLDAAKFIRDLLVLAKQEG